MYSESPTKNPEHIYGVKDAKFFDLKAGSNISKALEKIDMELLFCWMSFVEKVDYGEKVKKS